MNVININYNLLYTIFSNISCIIFFVIAHELSHAYVLYLNNIKFKFGTNIISTWIEFNEQDFDRIKNTKLFYSAGSIGVFLISVLLLLLSIIFKIDIKYGLYGITIGLLNIFIIFPKTDFYHVFEIDKYFCWNKGNLHLKGLWILIGNIFAIIINIFVIYEVLF